MSPWTLSLSSFYPGRIVALCQRATRVWVKRLWSGRFSRDSGVADSTLHVQSNAFHIYLRCTIHSRWENRGCLFFLWDKVPMHHPVLNCWICVVGSRFYIFQCYCITSSWLANLSWTFPMSLSVKEHRHNVIWHSTGRIYQLGKCQQVIYIRDQLNAPLVPPWGRPSIMLAGLWSRTWCCSHYFLILHRAWQPPEPREQGIRLRILAFGYLHRRKPQPLQCLARRHVAANANTWRWQVRMGYLVIHLCICKTLPSELHCLGFGAKYTPLQVDNQAIIYKSMLKDNFLSSIPLHELPWPLPLDRTRVQVSLGLPGDGRKWGLIEGALIPFWHTASCRLHSWVLSPSINVYMCLLIVSLHHTVSTPSFPLC